MAQLCLGMATSHLAHIVNARELGDPQQVAIFDAFSGPVETRTRNFGVPYRRVPSDFGFARYLIERGLDEGVDWAVIESWDVDHGFMVPLFKLDPDARHPMVPIFINCASPPLPSPRRCYAVGRWLADAIRQWDSNKRVAIIATGGLSHSVGSVQQGFIDVDFDRRFLDDFCAGRGDALAALSDTEISATGSATGEIRSWIVLAGAFAGRPVERV